MDTIAILTIVLGAFVGFSLGLTGGVVQFLLFPFSSMDWECQLERQLEFRF